MPTPPPDPAAALLEPPDADEAALVARGMASAAAPPSGLTDFQRVLIEALFPAMTGHSVDLTTYAPVTPEEFARALARRNLQFRSRVVQLMLLCALVLRPLPEDVADRITAFAQELEVDEGMVEVAQRFADGALGLAAFDFERNGYTAEWHPDDTHELHTSVSLQAPWDTDVHDPELAARWSSLGDLAPDSIGRRVWEMYRARGFVFPGLPGSAPPLLAQHDWVHVLADYGTTVESELEVFAFVARANDDMRGFSLLAMVVSLFETGYLRAGAGLFEASPGHLSAGHGMAFRLADALRRGALCSDRMTGSDSIDYLRVDWFDLAPLPLDDVRGRFHVTSKADVALSAGSVGPWEPGGISPFQERCGSELAEREGRAYESYGATSGAG
ncbi:MAG TPA: hypothetical protein VFA62_06045 [Acidimicrobiia bacterium]|nr:hypothetical protein [Acidimicrobiia bacterium]